MGNPFLLPGSRPGGAPSSQPPLESGTRRVPRAPADAAPPVILPPAPAPAVPPPAVHADWRLVLPNGERIALDRPVVVGRDPAQPEESPDAHPVPVADPQHTVSKTHALLTPDPSGVRVRDLHSTNGTTLVLAGGRAPVPVEGELLIAQPAELELGRYLLRVEA